MPHMNGKRIKSICRFGKKYKPVFLIAEVCILISYTVSILLPLNLRRLTDDVLYGGQYDLLPKIIHSYILLFAISTVFNFIYAFAWQYLCNHYVLDIKTKLFEKVMTAKASFLSNMNSGDIMTRIDGDSEQFIHIVQRNLFHFVNSAIMCIGIVILVARINVAISIMLVVAAFLPIALTRFCGRFTERFSKKTREITADMVGKLYEFLKGYREIKLFNAGNQVKMKFDAYLKHLIPLGNKVRRTDFCVGKGIYLVNLSTSIAIYGFSVYLIFHELMTLGMFLAVIEYVALLHKKINWMLRIYLDWYGRKISVDRVNEILDLETEDCKGQELDTIHDVEFKNVDFGYEKGIPVLNKLSLSIHKGEKAGIVGGSGNGKTTTTALLLGFYKAGGGEILINGIPISKINLSSLRQRIGVVSQDIMIFEDTIRYNLNMGSTYSDEEIYGALESVKLMETVRDLPHGIDTVISSSSHNLSGGQKQRLMIARMLLKKPDFIIMDEATSALDVETEKAISDCLYNISKSVTMLIISHRLETIKDCDRIFVLNEHCIDSSGTHEELITTSSEYKKLFER